MNLDPGDSQGLARSIARRALDGGPLLALDHDGTLSPIAATPAAAMLPAETRELVGRLATRVPVAILSGRGMVDLEQRFRDLPVSLISEHGLRMRSSNGEYTQLARPPDPGFLGDARALISALLAGRADWIVEDKGVGIAVHYRNVRPAELDELLPRVREILRSAAGTAGSSVQAGHMVLELRATGASKGSALRHLAGLHHARPVVMIGDDLTDESAFEVAAELDGFGIHVSADDRPTNARHRLADPAAVAVFLAELEAELAAA
jgi:trehalose-phosphatase